jgi:hypothetical protein
MHGYGFRLTVAALVFTVLLVGSLVATPAAKAAITGSAITSPTDPTFLVSGGVGGVASGTFAISGTTSGGDPSTDQVDIRCYYGTTSVLVASGVALAQDGSFSVPAASMDPIYAGSGLGLCRLRAVPAGTTPADATPYEGPRVTTTASFIDTVSGGPNDGTPFDYFLFAMQLTGGFDYDSVADCGIDDGYLADSTLARTTTTFYCNAELWYQDYWEPGAIHSPTRSQLQIDGTNAYPPASAQAINQDATGLPPLSQTFSSDPATGDLVIHETDPLVKCPDATYPPTTTSCASFVSAGVTDDRTITQDHDGHVSHITDVFTSTDGQDHTLDLLYDNSEHFQDGSGDSTQIEYQFPGQGTYSMHAVDDSVSLPATPGTVFIRVRGAADGDTSTGQGAIVYDRPAAGALFMFSANNFQDFALHQTGTVPAGGSTRFRVAYVQDYLAANVASMAQEASTDFANTLSIPLNVLKSGNGSGTVTGSPAGISCGSTCSHGYAYGTPVTLTASPSTGSTFAGWSGACTGTGACKVTTNDAVAVTAHFSLIPETLTVTKTGNGQGAVTSSPGGINCGATCSHSYDYGSSVTLTVAPATGSTFTGWSGACTGSGTCQVTTNAAAAITANFSLIPEMLTVATTGDGQGTVSSSPAGISCGATCSHSYDYGSSVTLTATADRGSSFEGWTGACSGKAACTVSMSTARSLQAEFLKDCAVPKLKGKSLKSARRALGSHSCSLGKVTHAFSSKVEKGRVISQKPKPGKDLARGAKVTVVVSKGKKH